MTYVGMGTESCSSTLTKSSNLVVDLEIKIGSERFGLDGIDISSTGGDILIYTDYSGWFTGNVQGNNLSWTMSVAGDTLNFSGAK